MPEFPTEQSLLSENAELRARLEEAEETLRAIRNGEVDALVVDSSAGPQVFTLQGLDAELNRFRGAILEQVSDAVIVLGSDQHILYLNAAAAQQYGVIASQVLGYHITKIYQCSWYHPGDEAAMLAALSETGSWRGEKIHLKSNGETLHVEASMTRLRAGNGIPHGLLAVIRDISERKQAEQALIDADQRKDEFLAMLAHELRNPLVPIVNAGQILKNAGSEDSRIMWCSDIINRQAEHLTRMVDDLLEVTRIAQGKIELKKEPLTAADFVLPAMETSRPLIEARQQELSLALPPQPFWVNGDRVRLTQVISNLLNNASKFTAVGGHIGLTVEACGDEVCIHVSDTGCGIESSVLPNLFDLFYQVSCNLDRSQGGLGIGLSLVQRLVALHDGNVQAFSAGLGQGSEFVVRLPRMNPRETSTASTSALPSSIKGELCILIVDDYPSAAESLAMLLELRGHQVWIAHDGLSAFEMALAKQPRVVILDIGLPEMDGYAVAKKLRQCTELGKMLIIAVSGYIPPNDPEILRAAGFDEYLVKPVKIATIQDLLEKYRVLNLNRSL